VTSTVVLDSRGFAVGTRARPAFSAVKNECARRGQSGSDACWASRLDKVDGGDLAARAERRLEAVKTSSGDLNCTKYV